jgi:hypothetical protein
LAVPDCIAFLAGLKMRAVMADGPRENTAWKRVVDAAEMVSRWYKASLQEFESVIPGLDVTFSGPV